MFTIKNTKKKDLRPPEIEEALRFGRSQGFKKYNKVTQDWEDIPWDCDDAEFGRFGAGV